MMENKKPKLIIIESNDTVQAHIKSILSEAGWDVTCEKVPLNALNTLSLSKKTIFAMFITSFKLPGMKGDDILQKVKMSSPLTQRMLLVDADKPHALINAVNKAEINACISSPFEDEDLTNQAENCLNRFKLALKKQQLKRVTVHQNKQMLKIAQKLKKKDDIYKRLIEEKKAKKLMLKSKKREKENRSDLNTHPSLSDLIEQKGIDLTPDAFKNEFIYLCKTMKEVFDQVTGKHGSDPVELNLEAILKSGRPEEEKKDSRESSIEEHDSEKTLVKEVPVSSKLVEKIITGAFNQAKTPGENKSPMMDGTAAKETDSLFNEYFEISISGDQTEASIEKLKDFDSTLPSIGLSDLHDNLRQKRITHGILSDAEIETWMSNSSAEKITIAKGKSPVHGSDGNIKFHFETNFTNPGKICEDGSIDFRERGDIPYINKGELLAQKTLPREGKTGMSISGIPIQINEISDPVFAAGAGTEISEDGLLIHAATDGQPHLDALGTISVSPELVIPGDVDFKTGHIDFKGNIIVKGMIKEGFTVKGINLTAQEIEGGTIDLSGDLNISAGITDSTIFCHGNIYAKFINHSNIMGFGNLSISKEIIDSTILLSGSCQNPTGHIISSQITAKMGIEAGKIGTSSSQPAKLNMGVDDHIQAIQKQTDTALEMSVSKSNLFKDKIKALEDQDQELYQQVNDKAHIQDRAQLEIKELKKSLPEFERLNDNIKLQYASNKIKKLIKRAKEAEQELNTIFETQDTISNKIQDLKNKITGLEEKNKNLVIEKKALMEFSKKTTPHPVITVAKTITQDSVIKSPHASMVLAKDTTRCKIQELVTGEEGFQFHEINISDI